MEGKELLEYFSNTSKLTSFDNIDRRLLYIKMPSVIKTIELAKAYRSRLKKTFADCTRECPYCKIFYNNEITMTESYIS
jgi:hypothetical protein